MGRGGNTGTPVSSEDTCIVQYNNADIAKVQKAAEHAKEHGIRQVTPELIERVKANIRDE
jgi:hypothetical protein